MSPKTQHTDPVLADDIQAPPIIFMGLTTGEVTVVGSAGAVMGLFGALVLGLLANSMLVSVCAFAVIAVAATLGFAQVIRVHKENRPANYLVERLHRLRARYHLGGSPLILRSGVWSNVHSHSLRLG